MEGIKEKREGESLGRKSSARVLLKMLAIEASEVTKVDLGQVRAFLSTREDHRPAYTMYTPSPQGQDILVPSWVVLCARM